ncbi:hypothetical protein V6N13_070484 [Hibiscus sabdariffa]|uniref:Secreted protein n=1 Tax=Hibiscus sabdariffa TaxID=183260 RepID=A0ABR2TGA7_9ROSI
MSREHVLPGPTLSLSLLSYPHGRACHCVPPRPDNTRIHNHQKLRPLLEFLRITRPRTPRALHAPSQSRFSCNLVRSQYRYSCTIPMMNMNALSIRS